MSFPFHLAAHLREHSDKMVHLLKGDFRGLDEAERRHLAADARRISAAAAALIAPMPIPFADIWTITPVQMAMVKALGNIYGYTLDDRTVKALLATVGGGWLGQQACLALFKLGMPGAGGLGGAAFVFFWTHAMGHAAEFYFASGMTATRDELAEVRRKGMQEAKREAAPSHQ